MNDGNTGNGNGSNTNRNGMKVVYAVVERAPGKSYWTRIGVGFVNRDGSLNLKLDAIPLAGTLQVREWEPFDRHGDDSNGHARKSALPPAQPARELNGDIPF